MTVAVAQQVSCVILGHSWVPNDRKIDKRNYDTCALCGDKRLSNRIYLSAEDRHLARNLFSHENEPETAYARHLRNAGLR